MCFSDADAGSAHFGSPDRSRPRRCQIESGALGRSGRVLCSQMRQRGPRLGRGRSDGERAASGTGCGPLVLVDCAALRRARGDSRVAVTGPANRSRGRRLSPRGRPNRIPSATEAAISGGSVLAASPSDPSDGDFGVGGVGYPSDSTVRVHSNSPLARPRASGAVPGANGRSVVLDRGPMTPPASRLRLPTVGALPAPNSWDKPRIESDRSQGEGCECDRDLRAVGLCDGPVSKEKYR
jgi:hypothetical protein